MVLSHSPLIRLAEIWGIGYGAAVSGAILEFTHGVKR